MAWSTPEPFIDDPAIGEAKLASNVVRCNAPLKGTVGSVCERSQTDKQNETIVELLGKFATKCVIIVDRPVAVRKDMPSGGSVSPVVPSDIQQSERTSLDDEGVAWRYAPDTIRRATGMSDYAFRGNGTDRDVKRTDAAHLLPDPPEGPGEDFLGRIQIRHSNTRRSFRDPRRPVIP